jgi:hypothetical protein
LPYALDIIGMDLRVKPEEVVNAVPESGALNPFDATLVPDTFGSLLPNLLIYKPKRYFFPLVQGVNGMPGDNFLACPK